MRIEGLQQALERTVRGCQQLPDRLGRLASKCMASHDESELERFAEEVAHVLYPAPVIGITSARLGLRKERLEHG